MYKQSGPDRVVYAPFSPNPLRSLEAIAGVRNFQRFWWWVHADFGAISKLGESRPHLGSQRSRQRLPPTAPPKNFDSLAFNLRQLAEDLGIDPERLVVIAWSGNASAGLPAIEDARRKAIKAAVIYYGSADVSQVRLDLPVLFVRAALISH